jgi:transcriptional regulator with XRE-family HTH domain
MKEAKVKQVDLAKYAEVSYQTVSAWICGRGYPKAETMEKISRFFGVRRSALTEDQSITTQEDKLILIFRALSQEGRDKLLDRADELYKLYPKGRKSHG